MQFDIRTVKKIMLYVGIAAAAVAVFMTFSYGRTMSFAHGISMGMLTLVAAFIWTAADHYRKIGQRYAGSILMLLGALFTSVEYFSHIGYTVGNRVSVAEETGVTNTNWQAAQDSVKEDAGNLSMWRKQLDDLTAQAPWAATVSADGLRAQLASYDKEIELETARGGCKSKCAKIMKYKADIEDRIATAEKASNLNKQIEATQRILDGKRTTATKTEFKSSPIVNQTKFAAQLATLEIDPGNVALTWTQIAIGALIAFVTTFLAPVCFYIVFGDQEAPSAEDRLAEAVSGRLAPKKDTKGNTVFNIATLDDKAKEALGKYVASLQQNRQLYGGAAA